MIKIRTSNCYCSVDTKLIVCLFYPFSPKEGLLDEIFASSEYSALLKMFKKDKHKCFFIFEKLPTGELYFSHFLLYSQKVKEFLEDEETVRDLAFIINRMAQQTGVDIVVTNIKEYAVSPNSKAYNMLKDKLQCKYIWCKNYRSETIDQISNTILNL